MNRAPTGGDIVRTFKALSTHEIRKQWAPAFAWQRNYYEHIIRDERSLNGIRSYIQANPALWTYDKENPEAGHVTNIEINRVLADYHGIIAVGAQFIAPTTRHGRDESRPDDGRQPNGRDESRPYGG
ncbi:MAG: hypothetical protein M5R38_08310 [Candidatus Methylomirabilis sp.]|nr:hypothetical protein [Candidatus Methylomirabilis sp.]